MTSGCLGWPSLAEVRTAREIIRIFELAPWLTNNCSSHRTRMFCQVGGSIRRKIVNVQNVGHVGTDLSLGQKLQQESKVVLGQASLLLPGTVKVKQAGTLHLHAHGCPLHNVPNVATPLQESGATTVTVALEKGETILPG